MALRITILTDGNSWKNSLIPELKRSWKPHHVRVAHSPNGVKHGDLVFVLGFTKILSPKILARNKHNLIVHESALPRGRGWSPLAWQILEGKKKIPITLFEAVPSVDAGPIYLRTDILLKGSELRDEILRRVGDSIVTLCTKFVREAQKGRIRGCTQTGRPTYYPRRNAESNRLNPNQTIHKQFNILRIADPISFPAYFDLYGERFFIRISKNKEKINARIICSFLVWLDFGEDIGVNYIPHQGFIAHAGNIASGQDF